MVVKTDRKDARGIAQLLRWAGSGPCIASRRRPRRFGRLLVARKQLQAKMRDVELSLRGLLRGFGLKVGEISKGQFAARVRTLVSGHMMLERIAEAMLQAREALRTEFGKLHRAMLAIARGDEVCRRLMTVPGVGALIAVTFTSAVDDPGAVRPLQSGGSAFWADAEEVPIRRDGHHGRGQPGGRCHGAHGAVRGRAHPADAGGALLGAQALGPGGRQAARDEGAKVALARKLAVVLHRMWMDGTTFRWSQGWPPRRNRRSGSEQGRISPAPLRSRRRDEGSGEAVSSAVAARSSGPRVLDWLPASSLMAWCGSSKLTTNRCGAGPSASPRAGSPAPTSGSARGPASPALRFFGEAGAGSRDGAPRPSWQRPASPARRADASHARTASRCDRAQARSSPSRTHPRSPSDAPQPSPVSRSRFRLGTRSRRTRAGHPRCCAGSEARASTGRSPLRRDSPASRSASSQYAQSYSRSPFVPSPAERRCQALSSSPAAIASAVPATGGLSPQELKRIRGADAQHIALAEPVSAPSRPRPSHTRCPRPPSGTVRRPHAPARSSPAQAEAWWRRGPRPAT